VAGVDWFSSLGTLAATIVGGLVTFAVSRHYYVRAAQDLQRTAERLETTLNTLARFLEEAGIAALRFNREKDGRIVGLEFHLEGGVVARSGVSANVETRVIREDKAGENKII
jgi:hypothetical protein